MGSTFHTEIEYVRVDQINLQPLARHLLGTIRKAFEDPAVEAEFQAWKAERNRKAALAANEEAKKQ